MSVVRKAHWKYSLDGVLNRLINTDQILLIRKVEGRRIAQDLPYYVAAGLGPAVEHCDTSVFRALERSMRADVLVNA